jgi:hypothetical protein
MLCQSGGAEGLAPRHGGASRGLAQTTDGSKPAGAGGAAAVAPAQAADLGGKVSSNRSEDEFGFGGRRLRLVRRLRRRPSRRGLGRHRVVGSSSDDVCRKGPGQWTARRRAVTSASTGSSAGWSAAPRSPSAGAN